jgi:hypothetical protein
VHLYKLCKHILFVQHNFTFSQPLIIPYSVYFLFFLFFQYYDIKYYKFPLSFLWQNSYGVLLIPHLSRYYKRKINRLKSHAHFFKNIYQKQYFLNFITLLIYLFSFNILSLLCNYILYITSDTITFLRHCIFYTWSTVYSQTREENEFTNNRKNIKSV